MPINQDGAYESVRFQYQHEQDETFVLSVEYHHTEAGPTITLHNLLGSEPLSLPLSVYVDVVDYLRQRGTISGGVVKVPANGGYTPKPVSSRLMPTRVSNAPIPQYASPKVQPKQQQQDPANNQSPLRQVEEIQNSYTPQHAVLMVEDPDAPIARPKTATTNRPVRIAEERDPTSEIDQSFSLQAGAAKRASAGSSESRTLKRIIKPGEPEYLNPPS